MRIVFLILVALYWLLSIPSYAQSVVISAVEIECLGNQKKCNEIREQFKVPLGKPITLSKLNNSMKLNFLDENIFLLSWELVKSGNATRLVAHLKLKSRIREVEFTIRKDGKLIKIPIQQINLLSVQKNEFIEGTDFVQAAAELKSKIMSLGLIASDVSYSLKTIDGGTKVSFLVLTVGEIKIGDIFYDMPSFASSERIKSKLNHLKNEVWDKVKLEVEIEKLKRDLFFDGYYFSKIDYNVYFVNEKTINLTVQVDFEDRYNIGFRGNKIFSRSELLKMVQETVKNKYSDFSPENIKNELDKIYQGRGIYGSEIDYYTYERKGQESSYRYYFFNIKEGKKLKVSHITFEGNKTLSDAQLMDIFYEKGSVLASRDFLDESYIQKFPEILKNKYLSRGNILFSIEQPNITLNINEGKASVLFKMQEREVFTVGNIHFSGLSQKLIDEILAHMKNRINGDFDFIAFEDDVKLALKTAQEAGFLFGKILSLDTNDLIKVDKENFSVDIHIDFDLGKKAIYKGNRIVGNEKTKLYVITREIDLVEDEILTPDKIKTLNDRLSFLGLFSSVTISPLVQSDKENGEEQDVLLLISVKEREYGVIKVAPGFRTDLGYKISSNLILSNLWGENKQLAVNVQANRRYDDTGLDTRRRAENRKIIEMSTNLEYSHPYFFGSKMKFDSIVNATRRRFFGFDADIFQGSVQLSRDIFSFLNLSLRYQMEVISQYDATLDSDRGYFRIGGITPSLSMDFRDSVVTPRKGAYFSLSWERANPSFYSMKQDDIEINFFKLVSRNKFYLPISRDIVLALSLSMGVEKNLARDPLFSSNGTPVSDSRGNQKLKGYIPSIKVFRLSGVDLVRGFSDNEINKVDGSNDISQLLIQDKAYFTNIKFEPRYFVDDNLVVGIFMDGGKVFVNNFRATDLRTSAGASFKLVTPVGTLDFDYGVKLQRRYDSTGGRESFGRFHLTIGFF